GRVSLPKSGLAPLRPRGQLWQPSSLAFPGDGFTRWNVGRGDSGRSEGREPGRGLTKSGGSHGNRWLSREPTQFYLIPHGWQGARRQTPLHRDVYFFGAMPALLSLSSSSLNSFVPAAFTMAALPFSRSSFSRSGFTVFTRSITNSPVDFAS